MIRKLFKLMAYTKAPKATFAFLHPMRALKLGMLLWIIKRILGPSERAGRGGMQPVASPLTQSGGI
ncbi:MAG: hypothetical protein ACREM1_18695 [Longimicrobiales bacterium]